MRFRGYEEIRVFLAGKGTVNTDLLRKDTEIHGIHGGDNILKYK